jgi:hypothetical protein
MYARWYFADAEIAECLQQSLRRKDECPAISIAIAPEKSKKTFGTAPVTVHAQHDELPTPAEVIAEIESGAAQASPRTQQLVADEAIGKPVPPVTTATAPARADWNFDRQGREISTESRDGLPPELVRDLATSPEGYEASLEALRTSANRVLEAAPVDRNVFIAHFDTLSPSIQAKALQTLRAYPHLDLYSLVDRIQPKLTLSEFAEAQAWIKGLKK